MEEKKSKNVSEQKLGEGATTPWEQPTPEEKQAARPIRRALKKALGDIDSKEKAEEVAVELESAVGDQKAKDVAQGTPKTPSVTQAARKVNQAVETASPGDAPKQALAEAARQVVATEGREREAVSEAVQEALNPEQQGKHDEAREGSRNLLREAILRRMAPYDAVDARFFLAINHLPRTQFLNRFFYFLTFIFNGGAAWYAIMGLMTLLKPRLGGKVVANTAIPLMLATMVVEFPIKSYFRRKRPFITIVQAIVIGKKPGTWSFPSGHSASAFAGAWLLQKHFPKQKGLFYLIATMVAFSRIFLGDHYPGDVVAGSVVGTLLAKFLSRVQRMLFSRRK